MSRVSKRVHARAGKKPKQHEHKITTQKLAAAFPLQLFHIPPPLAYLSHGSKAPTTVSADTKDPAIKLDDKDVK